MLPQKKYNRVPSVFADIFGDQWPEVWSRRTTTPQINVIETDKKFKIEIAAPGMSKDDIKVELNTEGQLVVCLDKECEKDDKGKECCGDKDCDKDEKHHYLRREFTYTSFRQVFNLPDNVDRDKIEAKMKHGVLRIKLPKKADAELEKIAKKIDID